MKINFIYNLKYEHTVNARKKKKKNRILYRLNFTSTKKETVNIF